MWNNRIEFSPVSSFCICSLTFTGCQTKKRSDRYVVVLSMDGFRSDYPSRTHIPMLDSLAGVGACSTFRPCYSSVTFPNHYSMTTGLHPDHHDLVNNFFYDAELDSSYRVGNLDPRFHGGEPIWDMAKHQGVRTASFYWVGSEVSLASGQPSIWKPFDKSVSFSDRADSVISWLKLPEDIHPHLTIWHMKEPDAIGHSAILDSSAILSMVESLDKVLSHFFTGARKLDIFDKIDFIVLSDHGMTTYYPERYVNLNDYLPRDSSDYVFNSIPTLLCPKKTYVDTAYAVLQRVPNITVWKKNEIPEKLVYRKSPRVNDLVVFPHIETYTQFCEKSSPRYVATHDYDNSISEMKTIFYAAGPSSRKRIKIPRMVNVDLYLMAARLLNIQLAPNDGDSAVVQRLFK